MSGGLRRRSPRSASWNACRALLSRRTSDASRRRCAHSCAPGAICDGREGPPLVSVGNSRMAVRRSALGHLLCDRLASLVRGVLSKHCCWRSGVMAAGSKHTPAHRSRAACHTLWCRATFVQRCLTRTARSWLSNVVLVGYLLAVGSGCRCCLRASTSTSSSTCWCWA